MTNKEIAKLLGSAGGQATAKKYSKEQRQQWGKKGGRPKKERAL